MVRAIAVLAAFLALGACTSSGGVVPMNKGTYLITLTSAQVGTGAPVAAKSKAYAQANEFCNKDGQAVETVSLDESNSKVAHPGSVALQFKCVPK